MWRASVLALAAASAACSGGEPVAGPGPGADAGDAAAADWTWDLPVGFPKPKVPADNPMSRSKVELGRRLFYDKRLSGNQTQSCASCHQQARAFADDRALGLGSTGESHTRGPMALGNIAYANTLTWANPLMTTLEKQALVPMFGDAPVELGLAGKEDELLARLRAEPKYQELFPKAFPSASDPFSLDSITKAIAAFERSLISSNSPYDRFLRGDGAAISDAAKRGKELFFSERLECFHCHGGFNFADSTSHEGTAIVEVMFHNTALYNIDGNGGYPADNTGVHAITHLLADMGRFKAPTLRNIALTAPYMHDGSIATLDAVIDHYAAGGRTIAAGPNSGDGSKSPLKSEFLKGFVITADERKDLLEFLDSLTDKSFVEDSRYADPWPR